MPIPDHGLPADDVLRALESYKQHDAPWREGKLFAGVYDPGEQADALIKAAYTMFLGENALYPNYYPSLLRLESEVTSSLAALLGGDAEVVGSCTSGGTESIMLALKAARDKARAERPEIAAPEIVLPHTAHAAFHKAALYLGLRPVLTPFDPESFRAIPEAIAQAITPNTVLIAASAPGYSHGVVDPIPAIGAIALERGIPFHVDACVGGLQLAVMRSMGYEVPAFDFAVPGVTSISVDMHKYGYAAKNASVLLYRNRALRRYALFASAATTGYLVINTTVLSSRTGGPIAAAWAALQHLGMDGYQQITREVMGATAQLLEGLRGIPELRVLGQPDMSLVAFSSDVVDVFALDDELTRRGWALQPQFHAGGGPANLHITVSRSNVPHIAALLADLREAIAAVRARPAAPAIHDEVARLLASPGPDTFAQLAALAGIRPGSMPEGYAQINGVLDALPDDLAALLLTEYLNTLYS
ncbi:aspartate aminotransferase family protein [Chloroflexia bacterium SDU3-3]|nr:aspartate aminotransferase family protein [Chloroflexia bacterium SDU3-3]